MNLSNALQQKIEDLIAGNNPLFEQWDNLNAESDADYMLYSPQVVGYNTTTEQQYLFQNLVMGLDPRTSTILDVACGRADLYGYLTEVYGKDILGYTGVDLNPFMADLAKQKYGVDIINSAFGAATLKPHNYVVASGFFTQRRAETEDADLSMLLVDVDAMYQLATNVVAFNLLCPINNAVHEGFFYVHPGLIMDMLIEKYQYVNIRHNYSKDVYTVTIFKK